jgi:hypothetical protein
VGQTAKLLGFAEHDISILTAAKLLDPLGTPAPNAPKFFAKVLVMEHAGDPKWLDKATRVIGKYWQSKRSRRSDAALGRSTRDTSRNDLTEPSVKSSVTEQ